MALLSTRLASLLACPACASAFRDGTRCESCGRVFESREGVLDLVEEEALSATARKVERFYEERPFPGYAPEEDAASLLDRSRRSSFLRLLDEAIPRGAAVLDFGCGTGQLAAFLAASDASRLVVGADLCRASLERAEAFRARAGIENLLFVRADLFRPPMRREAFDVATCRGVLHHTEDWERGLAILASLAAPGGRVVLGFYESLARLPHRGRRFLARLVGRPVRALDPMLRRRDLDPEKKRTWIEDQYRHPHERCVSLSRVRRAFERSGLTWVRSVPPAVGEGPLEGRGALFEPRPAPGALAAALSGLAWALRSGEDAGLVVCVGRKTTHMGRSLPNWQAARA